MANFDVVCPKAYPNYCTMTESEKSDISPSNVRYKVFFMYPSSLVDTYHINTIKSYMVPPNYYVLDWDEDKYLGVKICKICRLALAADFGIALLTPRNFNVFLEIGYMLGLAKPVLYLFDKKNNDGFDRKKSPLRTKDLPFDLGQEIVFEYESEADLKNQLPEYLRLMDNKVEILTPFQKRFRETVIEKITKLKEYPLPEIIAVLLVEKRPIRLAYLIPLLRDTLSLINEDEIDKSISQISVSGIIIQSTATLAVGGVADSRDLRYVQQLEINQAYRPILEKILFEPGVIEKLINRKLWEK